MRGLFGLLLATALAGCASYLPDAIRKAPSKDISVAQVRRDIAAYKGQYARWGGTIASAENLKDATLLEIVARDLDSDGRPRDTDASQGRFIARVSGFLDPTVYAEGREITVAGTIEGSLVRKIGEYEYTYPVLNAAATHLWPQRVRYPPGYYYYDPFWPYPPYPWGYPYYYPYYRYWW